MAKTPTPDEASEAMLRGFRGEPEPDHRHEAVPGAQSATCPNCGTTFNVGQPTRVTEQG